jgi:hypothetical protein
MLITESLVEVSELVGQDWNLWRAVLIPIGW